jgi:hypothetical protein
MAFTSQQIRDYLIGNPGMTDAQIVAAMETFQISPAQMASAVGLDEGAVAARVGAVIPPNQAVLLGDTYVQAVNQVIGSGEDQQVGALENVITYKASENQAGGNVNYYSPTGEYQQTTQQKEVAGSFLEGLGQAITDPVVLAALAGGYGAGLFGGAGALGGAATVGTTGLTMAELAQLDLALGGAGGTAGATSLASALTTGAAVPTLTNLTGGSGTGLLTTPTVASAATPTATATTAANSVLTPTATGALTPTATGALTPAATSVLTPAATSVLAPAVASALTPTATNIATSLIPTAVRNLLTPTNIGNLVQSGATTGAGLLQQQTSREAAQKAQAMIDAETAAAKQAAQFRPIGMTTRFGTSQFQVDPRTGQLTSAGYTLSPEAKNAQDRFLTLAGAGLTQAEQAQQQFAPLQTGAQRLFGLGNQYLAQNPQEVAQNYLNQQMALLQPGRETELANLQNRLQQQGRGGLSVAQGGTLGATTPELQALYNARAQQEAQLAANAQQFGQQQVQFGAGLLGTGAQTMGQYYGGQQAAYAPFTSAFGQMQALEAAGQQPFQLGVGLGKEMSTAGYNVGRLGLTGAGQSVALATGADATRNPYASALSGAAANPLFGQVVGGLLGGTPATSGFSYGQYGTGIDPTTGEYFGSLYF